MSRYMFIARYESTGVKGVVSKGGTARASVIEKVAAGLGGHMETFDFAFGEDDVYTLCEPASFPTTRPPRPSPWR